MSIPGFTEAAFAVVLSTLSAFDSDADPMQVFCAAQNVWFEAAIEDRPGWTAVTNVVENRVESDLWEDTICKVVWQDAQFSWTHDGKSDRVDLSNGYNRTRWREIVEITVLTLDGAIPDITGGAVYYHEEAISPSWAGSLTLTTQVGSHIFYQRVDI